jgi:2-amino-4-hydroxy-6-hydroxymethyldihydropteridine diphosphokinase
LSKVAIALGSNVGDRESHLAAAVARLQQLLGDVRVSAWRETAPIGVAPQADFLNGALVGTTALTPRELLDALLQIERDRGRVRPYEGAPRPLDLDLILYGEDTIDEPGLQVPHPRFRDRLFVLEPLAELAPDWIDPVTRHTMGRLLAELRTKNEERRTTTEK